MNPYIGHEQQLYGVTEVRLTGGKGDGMRMLHVRNAAGLSFVISLDRCADITQLSFKGDNLGYFAPCGYVAPAYYDDRNSGFFKNFTAGFFATCGLNNVGPICFDEGVELPTHGSLSNVPCDNSYHFIKDDAIHIKATMRDARMFSYQLILEREYICPLYENAIYLHDTIYNIGSRETPVEIMYHCNMGYPLLSEKAEVSIPSEKVEARNEHAASGLDRHLIMEKPQRGYKEMCYFHTFTGTPTVSIYNEEIRKGLEISYNAEELPCFTQWKMMGEYDYALGLEPANCLPLGRDVMRERGMLEYLAPGEEKETHLTFRFFEKEY
ncbi:MAG: aldose 1-epimerase family protein [Clostridia bacterium]|nr:aldose 1-epimerase family protein [Clostridia bacterium]